MGTQFELLPVGGFSASAGRKDEFYSLFSAPFALLQKSQKRAVAESSRYKQHVY
jgi:hypothetical protein